MSVFSKQKFFISPKKIPCHFAARLFILLVLLFSLFGGFAYALEINYPALPGYPTEQLPQNAPSHFSAEELPSIYFKYIVYLAIFLSISIAVVSLFIGSFIYILFSSQKAERKVSARNQITAALLGLLILFSSVILLRTINPQLVIFKMPELKTIPVTEKSEITEPPSDKIHSLINIEIPIGTIIEKRIFETESSEHIPRMERIRKIAVNFLSVAEKIKDSDIELEDMSLECFCEETTPSGPQGCTCDPCKSVRSQIQDKEKENLKLIGIKIIEGYNNSGNPIITDPYDINFISEQEKANEESRLLKEEIGKLEKSEKLMFACDQFDSLSSLAELIINKEVFRKQNEESEEEKWYIAEVNFWGNVKIDANKDFATFYCPVGGTIFEQLAAQTPEKLGDEGTPEKLGEEIPENIQEVKEQLACDEIPLGRFIDKSKRVAYKIVERLEKLVQLSQQISDSTNRLHTLISQCTSQNCTAYYPETSDPFCQGDPCPEEEIKNEVDKIKDIFEKMEKTVSAPIPHTLKTELTKEQREEVGLASIIQNILPQLIIDFKKEVRSPMAQCATDPPEDLEEEEEQPSEILSKCRNSIDSVVEGIKIRECYSSEKEYQECLSQCYLERNYNLYQECLWQCLKKESDSDIAEIRTWFHLFDFFCCGK